MSETMTLRQAVKLGVARVRRENWRNRLDRMEIDLLPGGFHGPWLHIKSPESARLGLPTEQNILWSDVNMDEKVWEEWYAPTDD